MPRYFRKVENHPDLRLIKRWKSLGWSNRRIANALKRKYPNRPDLQIDQSTISLYFREYPVEIIRSSEYATTEGDIASRIMTLVGERVRLPREIRTFTDAELKAFRRGVKGMQKFCEELIRWKGKPVILQDYQIEMVKLLLKHKRTVFVTGRQVGKDFIIALFCVWECITQPNWKIVIASAAQRQTRLIMDRILTFINSSPEIQECVLNVTQEEISFTNNSVIYGVPATGFIRGYSEINRIFANEVRDIPDESFDALYPMLSITGGFMGLLSTPFGTRGHLWESWNNPMFRRMRVPTHMNQYVDREFLEYERKHRSYDYYRVEYLGEFLDIQNTFFNPEVIDRISKDYEYEIIAPSPDRVYSLGIDWARLRDTSVMIVSGCDASGLIKVEYIKSFLNVPLHEQVAFIQYLDSKYNFRYVIPEYMGLGIGPTDELAASMGFRVQRFRMTAEKRLQVYDHAKSLAEKGHVVLPLGCDLLRTELKMFQFKTTPRGTITLGTEISNDYADAFVLSVWPFHRAPSVYGTVVRL